MGRTHLLHSVRGPKGGRRCPERFPPSCRFLSAHARNQEAAESCIHAVKLLFPSDIHVRFSQCVCNARFRTKCMK